jgi:hypothetical protein
MGTATALAAPHNHCPTRDDQWIAVTWLSRDLGVDADAVLSAVLGYTPQRLDALHARGII